MMRKMTTEDAEAVGIDALAFVASDAALLPRFLAITGIDATQIRRAAGEPGFLAGVLRFIAAHEPTLIAFAQASGRDPTSVGAALAVLPGGDDNFERSA